VLKRDIPSLPPSLLSKVLEKLVEFGLRKVVLLGDVDQLPSIEPGSFLADMYFGLKALKPGICVDLRTNHRSEARAIVDNAVHIINGKWGLLEVNANETFRHQLLSSRECFR
jgi:ATP-dependent exoDNAse (exonuclease V) alpha subunit